MCAIASTRCKNRLTVVQKRSYGSDDELCLFRQSVELVFLELACLDILTCQHLPFSMQATGLELTWLLAIRAQPRQFIHDSL